MAKYIEYTLQKQQLLLDADRALFWKNRGILVVADPHFGKAQHFRESGIPVPRGTTCFDLERLSHLLSKYRPATLLFLGDLTHDKIDRPTQFYRLIDQWRNRHSKLTLLLASGNHDHRSGDPPVPFRFDGVSEKFRFAPFGFSHKPDTLEADYMVSGHLHPAVRMKGLGRQNETLPCFYFGARQAILPAFGSFTGNQTIRPTPDDRIFVIVGDEILEANTSLNRPR